MAAPSATVRQDPVGIKLPDGYRALITLEDDPDISFWEKDVKPVGVDGGELIPQTTMHNDLVETFYPQSLYRLTDGTSKVAYDPQVITQIMAMINRNQVITVRYRDGSTDAFWGCLRMFERDALQKGTQPEATVTFSPTNTDDAGAEQVLVNVSVSGS